MKRGRFLFSLWRLLTRFYPTELRRDYGREMDAVFGELLRRSSNRKPFRRRFLNTTAFAVSTIKDFVVSAAGAWRDVVSERRRVPRTPYRGRGETMQIILQDFRYSLRQLKRSPAFTAGVVVALAFSIGATTALFSVVNAVILKPLPFRDPDRLAMVWESSPSRDIAASGLSMANFDEWRTWSSTFEEMAAYTSWRATLTSGGVPIRVPTAWMSPALFPVLGVELVAGRGFLPEEEQMGGARTCLLGEGLWRSRYAGDPGVLGTALNLNGGSCTVVGVAPAVVLPQLSSSIGVWLPLRINLNSRFYRDNHHYRVVGRLSEGGDLEQASTEMAGFAAQATRLHPTWNLELTAYARPLHEQLTADVRTGLMLLQGAVGFVLLIACVNVASLMLARATQRRAEMAMRKALGAGQVRLIRQGLTEAMLLSSCGALAGLAVSSVTIQALRLWGPATIPRLQEATLDGSTLLLTCAITGVVGILFGMLPSFQARGELTPILGSGRQGLRSSKPSRFGRLLVTAEVALALVLLAGAGLLLKSFLLLSHIDPGFRPESRFAMSLDLPSARYQEPRQAQDFYRSLIGQLETLPAVESAAAVYHLPLAGSIWLKMLTIEGLPANSAQDIPTVYYNVVTPGYFETMGIRLAEGREFSPSDDARSPGVAIVNQSFASLYFGGRAPLGRRIMPGIPKHLLGPEAPDPGFPWYRVVGVVNDLHYAGLDEDPAPVFYLPLEQHLEGFNDFNVVVKAHADDPPGLMDEMRSAVGVVDPELPVEGLRRLEELVSSSVASPRFNLGLVGAFGVAALLLAAAGVYGLFSYSVAHKKREIGIRMALGAARGDVVRMIAFQTLKLAAAGTLMGLGAALALSRFMEGLLFRIKGTDPSTLGLAAALLIGVALLAASLPARRASKTDPSVVLRRE